MNFTQLFLAIQIDEPNTCANMIHSVTDNKIIVEESLMHFLTIEGGIVNIAIAGRGTSFSQENDSSSIGDSTINLHERPQSSRE